MRYRLILFFAILTTALYAQEEFNPELPPEPDAMYKIYVSVEPKEAGSASTSGSFMAGQVITMNSSALSTNYRFVKWTRDGEDYSTTKTFKYTVEAKEAHFVAHFVDIRTLCSPVNLVSVPAEACTFNKTSGTALEQGKSVSLVAYSDVKIYKFLGWYNGETQVSTSTSYTFSMPTPSVETTLTAKWEFDPVLPGEPEMVNYYEIITAADPVEGGTVLGGGEFQEGKSIVLSAKPTDSDWVFLQWQDGEKKNPRAVTVTQDATYTANFKNVAATSKTLTFSASPQESCSFNRTSGELIDIGESISLIVLPNSDFVFQGWYNGSDLVSEELSYTFEMPSEDYTLEARFEFDPILPDEPELTDAEAPKISVNGTEIVGSATHNTGVTLTITDDIGVTSVTINGVEKESPYKIPAENGEYVVEAKDAAGNTTTVTITIKDVDPGVVDPEPVDEEAPVISVNGQKLGSAETFSEGVTLDITDNVGVVSVTINGEVVSEEPYSIPAENGEYVVEAKDAAGNTTTVTITIKGVDPGVVDPEPVDEEAPVISVNGQKLGATETFSEGVTLDITDNVGVASVTINGEVVAEEPYSIPTIDDEYVVVAKDAAWNSTQTIIKIEFSDDSGEKDGGEGDGDTTFDPSKVDISTTVFRTVKGVGIEIISKDAVVAKIYDEQGNRVARKGVRRYKKIKLEPGNYTMDVFVGEKKLYSKIPFKVGK